MLATTGSGDIKGRGCPCQLDHARRPFELTPRDGARTRVSRLLGGGGNEAIVAVATRAALPRATRGAIFQNGWPGTVPFIFGVDFDVLFPAVWIPPLGRESLLGIGALLAFPRVRSTFGPLLPLLLTIFGLLIETSSLHHALPGLATPCRSLPCLAPPLPERNVPCFVQQASTAPNGLQQLRHDHLAVRFPQRLVQLPQLVHLVRVVDPLCYPGAQLLCHAHR